MLNKGFVLENRYKIVNIAGKGGTSVVYRAVDLKANNAQRAVKEVMKTNGADAYNARQESLLIKEFCEKDVKNSYFPNIIEIIDNKPEALYIVQDYIDGVSMEKLLAYDPFRQKTFKEVPSIGSIIGFASQRHAEGYRHRVRGVQIIFGIAELRAEFRVSGDAAHFPLPSVYFYRDKKLTHVTHPSSLLPYSCPAGS